MNQQFYYASPSSLISYVLYTAPICNAISFKNYILGRNHLCQAAKKFNSNKPKIMATKSEKTDLSELLAKAEEDFKVSQNGMKTIETLKELKSVGNNQRFKTLLDKSVKLICEKQQTIGVILIIGTLYYDQSDDKNSVRWFLKYLTKLKLETTLSESEKIDKSLTAEYMLGCCYFNLNNFKMAHKSLKTSPPDPSNVSKYKKHCEMLITSCHALELLEEMLMYRGFSEENPSGLFYVYFRIENAKRLIHFGKIAGAKQHLNEASNILSNCPDEPKFWLDIGYYYTNLEMFQEGYNCRQKFVDSFKDKSLDPPPDDLVRVLLIMASDIKSTPVHKAIDICQHILELLQKAPAGDFNRSMALNIMADSYFCLRDFGPAIKYYEESLEEMKKAYKKSDDTLLDYWSLSRVWSCISEAQLALSNYQMALKAAKRSAKYLKMVPGKYPTENIRAAINLSFCWRKLKHPQKAIMFMNSAIKVCQQLKKEDNLDYRLVSIDTKMAFIGACEHQLSGNFDQTDAIFKSILLQEASNGLEHLMKTVHFCTRAGRMYINEFPEDGHLFWSRLDKIYCNDANFLLQLPTGFKKCFLLYKNSFGVCNLLKQSYY
jgi:tetratricopeptide (TPR) repeat protein